MSEEQAANKEEELSKEQVVSEWPKPWSELSPEQKIRVNILMEDFERYKENRANQKTLKQDE